MARILLFQHVPYEPLGVLSPLIRQRGHRIRYINFSRDPEATPDVSKYDALIILGGPANVDEIDKAPHLYTEIDSIKKALDHDLPILGICLGCHMLAAACGASVYRADCKEVGWHTLRPTIAGADDPLIRHWQPEEKIFQWHGRTFDIPAAANQLVEGNQVPHQAFSINHHAYGFQFHLEVSEPLIKRWVSLPIYRGDLDQADIAGHQQQILNDTTHFMARSEQLAKDVFGAFLDLLPGVERQISLPTR